MAIKDTLINIEKRLQKLAGETAPREPLEIRQAVLDAIADMARPTGRGRNVMPFDGVDVEILAASAEARREFDAVLGREGGLDAAVRKSLVSSGCELPRGFAVTVQYRRKLPAGWTTDQRFAVAGHASEPAPAPVPDVQAAAPTLPRVSLKVVRGRASRRALEVRAERINVGRQEEVSDRDRRLVRRNHLAFVEGDEVSASVSRAHAHIRCTVGECRLHDDGSAYGTRIDRGGRMIEVAAGNTRGVKLQDGDALHFGRAVVELRIG